MHSVRVPVCSIVRAPLNQARAVRVHASYEAFRHRPGNEVSLEEAMEAYELCRSLTDERQKEACYAVFGVHGEAVERYLPMIMALEQQWLPESTMDDFEREDLAELKCGSYILKLQRERPSRPRRPSS